jgi:UDP-N-acetylmuramate: L-alanyl-gamma-D-glutamyl-meso-diaminopimelate ligase
MNLHIIGVCGTFMGGLARLACDLGMRVSGSDANTYPPMSTQLESLGIKLYEGYRAENIPADTELVIVGNSISRGNPELEHVLNKAMPYTSGAQWLGEHVLQGRWVLAIAGTHGKTTTSSLLAWLLEDNDLAPGFLIGGVPENFGESARLGETSFFVIEADEYDTAFSDKRSKFVHYRPRTLVLNNLEFDHADIFPDLAAIQTQFHHLLKTVPQHGQVIVNQHFKALQEVIDQGLWSEIKSFGSHDGDWAVEKIHDDGSRFVILHQGNRYQVDWPLIGDHNMYNALAAVAAAHHVGVPVEHAVRSLTEFKSVKRRLEKIYDQNGVRVYDDFAHHPTAIQETLNGLRNQVGNQPIIAVLEPRSNTMKQGIHKDLLGDSLAAADQVLVFAGDEVHWNIRELENQRTATYDDSQRMLEDLLDAISSNDQPCNVLIMSNGGFDNIYQRLLDNLTGN